MHQENATTFGYIDQDGKLVRIKIEDFSFATPAESGEAAAEGEEPSTKSTDALVQGAGSSEGLEKHEASDGKRTDNKEIDEGQAAEAGRKPAWSSDKTNGAGIVAEGKGVQKESEASQQGSSESPTPKPPLVLQADPETPLPRLNACLAMKGNELIIYGGLVELGKKDLTLDDCWSINVNTR